MIRSIFISLSILFGFSTGLNSQQTNTALRLNDEIRSIVSPALDRSTIVSVTAIDLVSGKTVVERASDLLLRPASNQKLLTTAASLLLLDSSYRFSTRVLGKEIDAARGLWSVKISAGADPLFTSQDIHSIVENISKRGVRRVGTIDLDATLIDSEPSASGWMIDDAVEAFQPSLSAFTLDHNSLSIVVNEDSGRIKTAMRPMLTSHAIMNHVTIGRKDSLVASRLENSTTIVSGTLRRGGRDSVTVSIPDPKRAVLDRFILELRTFGIEVDSIAARDESGPWTELASISHTLDEVIAFVNKQSDNLGAELLLKLIGKKTQDISSTHAGIRSMRGELASHSVDTSRIAAVDGSGLSFYNLTTTRTLAHLLARMFRAPQFERFKRSLAVMSVDGTVAKRLRDVANARYVYVKTGTLRGISNLSGYVIPLRGTPLCFSIFVQNFLGPAQPIRSVQDAIVAALLRYSVSAATPPR